MTSDSCSVDGNPIYQSCDCDIPRFFCALANISGYCSTVAWFLVLLPQVIRNFRHRTVQGISLGWAILNFTAAFNNAFFVFKFGGMPWYVYGSAVYMPILEILLLIQFYIFTPASRAKNIAAILLVPAWIGLAIIQSVFDVYKQLEWLSIVLWSAETFPQIFLNIKRRSTYGLANMSVTITAVGKTTDFMQNYLLIMPIQYVIMAFFSSTVAQVQTLQVLWYWKKRPINEACDGPVDAESRITTQCNVLRVLGYILFGSELVIFIVALILRTSRWWLIAAPIVTYTIIVAFYLYDRQLSPTPVRIAAEKDENQERIADF
ncbi:unnamed protein product, partial [Mesorhabditis belari]|uniref:Uncharacterized protein n=1 Tax=Mesorhabditis belari TaxID=2138241 RepID=A0AAF3EC55_9BILA